MLRSFLLLIFCSAFVLSLSIRRVKRQSWEWYPEPRYNPPKGQAEYFKVTFLILPRLKSYLVIGMGRRREWKRLHRKRRRKALSYLSRRLLAVPVLK